MYCIRRVIACAPEQCTCPACGAERKVIGYDQSEQLDVEPARYFVRVTKREKIRMTVLPSRRSAQLDR